MRDELDDLFDTSDPEFQMMLIEVRRHAKYHHDHPELCPHRAITAPIVDGKGDQPGFCLDCEAHPVMERETDCPLCKEEDE